MKTQVLKFACFQGLSLMSVRIRNWTRGIYSHIASYLDPEAIEYLEHLRQTPMPRITMIEQWPHGSVPVRAWMDYSNMIAHTPGTPYEIWGLEMPVTDWQYCLNHYRMKADKNEPYDWAGILAFVTHGSDDPDKTFCSEICIQPVKQIMNLDRLDPSVVHPSYFVNLIQAAGGSLINQGIV